MSRLINADELLTHSNFATTLTSSNYVITSGWYFPGNGMYGVTNNTRARKKCVYCDCLNDSEYGTCKYCGAPLGSVEERNKT